MIRDVELRRDEQDMLDAYRAACAALARLDSSPVYALRERRRAREDFELACELADSARDAVALRAGGYTSTPRPTREVLLEAAVEVAPAARARIMRA